MCSVFQLAADECLVDICCQCDLKVSANVWRFVVFFFIQLLDLEHKYGQAVPCLPPPHQQPNMLCSCFTCSDNIVFYIWYYACMWVCPIGNAAEASPICLAAMVGLCTSVLVDEETFKADRPFFYTIRHHSTDTLLFTGVIQSPST